MPRYVGLVVHGAGGQEKGSTLKDVGEPLVELIRRSNLDRKAQLRVAPAGDPGAAWAEITLPIGHHSIRLEEVWWARSFRPPSVQSALGYWFGAWRGLVKRGGGILWRGLLRLVPGTKRPSRDRKDSIPSPRSSVRRPISDRWPIPWQVVEGFVIFLQRLMTDLVTYAALVLFLPLAAVMWLLSVNPVRRFLPKFVSATYDMGVNILTRHVGDVSVYLDDAWEAARIQEVFRCRFEAMMEQKANEYFVIAHSLGAAVTYEGLLRAAARAPNRPRVRFIAVGAALNRARGMLPRRADYPCEQLPDWVSMTYIYARHDPIAMGDLVEPEEWAKPPPKPLEVVNQEDMFSDHTTYWSNAEEVMAPILRIITGKRLDVRLREGCRRFRVILLAFLKFLAWLPPAAVFFWMAFTNWSEAFGAWAYEKPVLQTPVRFVTQPPPTPSIAIRVMPGAEIEGERAVTVGEPFEVAIVVEPLPERIDSYHYYGYRYLLTWDQGIIAFDGASEHEPDDLVECEEPQASDSGVSGGCSVPEGSTEFQGSVTTIRLRCIDEGESTLHLVPPEADENLGTALLGGEGWVQAELDDFVVVCLPPSTFTPTSTESLTETATPVPTLTATPTVAGTPTVTGGQEDSDANGQDQGLVKPWNQPNDLLRVFGGRWTLEHLALPLLAAAFVAVAVWVVYNLIVKTVWNCWDRRNRYKLAPSPEDEAGGGHRA